jgi:hypothetical protein
MTDYELHPTLSRIFGRALITFEALKNIWQSMNYIQSYQEYLVEY